MGFLLGNIFGNITNPWEKINPGATPYLGKRGEGLIFLFNNILKTVVVMAGIWSLINIIAAGYGFLSAQANPEKISAATAKIWQSLIGLVIVAGSFVIAAVFGKLVFGDATVIIQPKIYGP